MFGQFGRINKPHACYFEVIVTERGEVYEELVVEGFHESTGVEMGL